MCVGFVICRALGFKERAPQTMGASAEDILAAAMVLVRFSIVAPMCWCRGVGLERMRCAARCWAGLSVAIWHGWACVRRAVTCGLRHGRRGALLANPPSLAAAKQR